MHLSQRPEIWMKTRIQVPQQMQIDSWREYIAVMGTLTEVLVIQTLAVTQVPQAYHHWILFTWKITNSFPISEAISVGLTAVHGSHSKCGSHSLSSLENLRIQGTLTRNPITKSQRRSLQILSTHHSDWTLNDTSAEPTLNSWTIDTISGDQRCCSKYSLSSLPDKTLNKLAFILFRI